MPTEGEREMSATVKLVNKTESDVTFGLWSAPNDHQTTKLVKGGAEGLVTLQHYDARIIGAWRTSNELYPSNEKPYTTGRRFVDNAVYTVTLTSDGISLSRG